jgi:ubiquinone/menaquinone biosynthesis C-methylase UbiE
MGDSFDEERTMFSEILLEEILQHCGEDSDWLKDKTIASIGCGCTGDLSTWPAARKIGIDPLLSVYDKLGMLIQDSPGVSPTLYLAVGAERLPLLDDYVDLVLCRNALDHTLHPDQVLSEAWRVLKDSGLLFLSVDLGGVPTPDEPTVFTKNSLSVMVNRHFDVQVQTAGHRPFAGPRQESVRMLLRKKTLRTIDIDKDSILRDYEDLLGGEYDR